MQYYKAVSGFALASFPGSLPSFFSHVVFTTCEKKLGREPGNEASLPETFMLWEHVYHFESFTLYELYSASKRYLKSTLLERKIL